MSQRKYTHIKVLEPEIVKIREAGMCKRAIAEHFGLETEQVKELLKRYRRRERKIAAGITPCPKAVRGRMLNQEIWWLSIFMRSTG